MTTYDPADDADKMRSLVQLAASVGNQLANVATSLAIEANHLDGADVRQLPIISTLIRRSARRIDSIACGLLKFASQAPEQPQTLSVTATLSNVDRLLRTPGRRLHQPGDPLQRPYPLNKSFAHLCRERATQWPITA